MLSVVVVFSVVVFLWATDTLKTSFWRQPDQSQVEGVWKAVDVERIERGD